MDGSDPFTGYDDYFEEDEDGDEYHKIKQLIVLHYQIKSMLLNYTSGINIAKQKYCLLYLNISKTKPKPNI
jgi:hypothetical protein